MKPPPAPLPVTTRTLLGVPFEIDETRPQDPAWFVLGIRKSGSSMFNRAVRLMARYNAVHWVDVAGTFFENNINVGMWQASLDPETLLRGGNVYGGFRDFPSRLGGAPLFHDGLKVLLVRDPRDAIVSEYFSNAYTHSIPDATGTEGAREDMLRRRAAALATAIDDFARIEGPRMAQTLEQCIPLLDDPRLLLLRYEDVIFDKTRMVNDVATHFGWTIRPKQMEAILKWIDVVPDVENPTAFIRKVTPGDHREKLTDQTIAQLNRDLARGMAAFGYK